jgi:hypothetical protein
MQSGNGSYHRELRVLPPGKYRAASAAISLLREFRLEYSALAAATAALSRESVEASESTP